MGIIRKLGKGICEKCFCTATERVEVLWNDNIEIELCLSCAVANHKIKPGEVA